MGAAVSLYRHLPLSDPRRQIRLLHVRPSSNHDGHLHASLSVHDLDESLKFTALSYEWGRAPEKNDDDKAVIRINCLWTRPIQANLDKALRHLRRPDKTLTVWVDAICIDQSDRGILEKADQVSIVAEIYRSASQTYVWIGPSADGSDVALTTLRKVGERMLKEDNGLSPRKQFERLTKDAPAGQWNKQSPDKLLQLAPDMIREYIPTASFCSAECRLLMSRSYWTRMWIQQEVVLSPAPIICCGSTQVGWNEFEAGLVFINLLKHHAVYGTLSKYGSTNADFDFSKWIQSDEKNYERRYFHPQWTVEESKNYEELGLGWNFEATALRRLRNRWSETQPSSPPPVSLPLLRVMAEEHAGAARHEVSRQEDRIYGLAGMASDIPRLEQFGFEINYNIPCREA
ncbi:heterokaryon incompatibility protein-domain-containing protein [Cercophora newfieldiana]|uniref:Heterokaryon incompatibility protein-domain-containing protein n=1 Tax=Cercophora newfieldiana TaxID=92897 RepID=A0AA39XZ69_9PEZI|nr:heterokaryon incompatibility protein-domain-containing protein [Cercophora newfieldiana]